MAPDMIILTDCKCAWQFRATNNITTEE